MKTEKLIKVNDSFWVEPGTVYIDNYNVKSLSKIFFEYNNLNTIQVYHSDERINLFSRNSKDYAIVGTRIVQYPIVSLDGIVFSIKKSADIDLNDFVTVIINNEIIENVCGYSIELNNYFLLFQF